MNICFVSVWTRVANFKCRIIMKWLGKISKVCFNFSASGEKIVGFFLQHLSVAVVVCEVAAVLMMPKYLLF